MLNNDLKKAIEDQLSEHTGASQKIISSLPMGGGSINDAFELQTNEGKFFLKVNSASRYPEMFRREMQGLQALREPGVIQVPEPKLVGEENDVAWIVMEHIEKGHYGESFRDNFGFQLASLHKVRAGSFGFENDNYIGSLSQKNDRLELWGEFFVNMRIEPLVRQARDAAMLDNGSVASFEKLYLKLDSFFPEEPPSLIHGDLWSGNFMANKKGEPVIYDPAVYYGHREMDIGMSRLFGGFDRQFYESYNDHFPMESGWEERIEVANLYPLMVHVILFGGSYLYDVKSILKRFS